MTDTDLDQLRVIFHPLIVVIESEPFPTITVQKGQR